MKKILIYNQKGGVGKTTISHHIGGMLSKMGKTVILADFDSQCNLTGLCLGLDDTNMFVENTDSEKKFHNKESLFKNIYETDFKNPKNIHDALSPAFEGRPIPMVACECRELGKNLYLMPGHLEITKFDVSLSIAHSFTTMSMYQNIPGAINHCLNLTAEKYNADYIIIDVSPTVSSINQNLFGISDYLIIPATPDFYSRMAINSISKTLSEWVLWYKEFSQITQKSDYPLPIHQQKFLGIILNNYKASNQAKADTEQKEPAMTRGFGIMRDLLIDTVNSELVLNMKKLTMMIEKIKYNQDYIMGEVRNYQTVITQSHTQNVPVFDIDIKKVPANQKNQYTGDIIDSSYTVFENIANQILKADKNN